MHTGYILQPSYIQDLCRLSPGIWTVDLKIPEYMIQKQYNSDKKKIAKPLCVQKIATSYWLC